MSFDSVIMYDPDTAKETIHLSRHPVRLIFIFKIDVIIRRITKIQDQFVFIRDFLKLGEFLRQWDIKCHFVPFLLHLVDIEHFFFAVFV